MVFPFLLFPLSSTSFFFTPVERVLTAFPANFLSPIEKRVFRARSTGVGLESSLRESARSVLFFLSVAAAAAHVIFNIRLTAVVGQSISGCTRQN